MKYYFTTGEEEIEASTEEEAIQIPKDNIYLYEGKLELDFGNYEIGPCAEVEKYRGSGFDDEIKVD